MKNNLYCYNRCCNCQKKCCNVGVIISGSFCAFFQLILIIFINLKFTKIDTIKEIIFGETPIYGFQLMPDIPYSSDYKYIESFYEWQGRVQIKKTKKGGQTISTLEKPKNISKIYGNYFVYSNDNRNYFDYLNSYSVEEGKSCNGGYKKCGILNSNGRILCLPSDEDCPLNDFFISNSISTNGYENYNSKTVIDNYSGKNYYIYYTNTKTDSRIITNFKLSKGFPCMFSKERSWTSILPYEKEVDPSCKTSVNGKLRDDRYTRAEGSDISLRSLYNDNNIGNGVTYISNSDKTVELYWRNYIHIDENCNNKFFEEIEKKNNSFKKTEILIKVLSGITFVLILLLVVYSILVCCCNLQFYILLLIAPAIGIILNISEIIFTSISKLRYKCSEKGYNSIIDELLTEDFYTSHAIILAMCITSIIALIVNIIFCIYMKFAKEQISTPYYNNGVAVAVALPVVNMAPQYPNYPQYPPYPQYPQNPQFVPSMNKQPVPGYGQPIPASSLEYNELQARNLNNEKKPIELLNQAPLPNMNNEQSSPVTNNPYNN